MIWQFLNIELFVKNNKFLFCSYDKYWVLLNLQCDYNIKNAHNGTNKEKLCTNNRMT